LIALRANQSADVAKILEANELESTNPISDHNGCEAPLLKAARNGCSADIFKLLLKCGANVHSLGNDRLTPLMIIVRSFTVRSFESEGAYDFSNGNVLQLGLDSPTWPRWSEQLPVSGRSCHYTLPPGLPRLSEDRCIDLATCLLQNGANALQLDPSGQSAPDVALALKKPRLAALLMYWYELRTCRLLRSLWKRYDQGRLIVGTTLMVPASVRSLLCQFLVPNDLDSTPLACTTYS